MSQKSCAAILGTGRAVPDNVVTNKDLEKIVDTSDSWIVERTGIKERRVAEPDEMLTDLASKAATAALEAAGVSAEELDLIVLGTASGDVQSPATACLVQERIGAHNAFCFDLSAACSGFLYSLHVADSLMIAAGYKKTLVIGGEIPTTYINWQDRDTCVLFGDGAGAVVLGPSDVEGRGLLRTCLKSDGRGQRFLNVTGHNRANLPTVENLESQNHAVRMDGREVYRSAVASMTDAMNQVLEAEGITIDDLDLFIPHQANIRIIEAIGKRLKVSSDKVYINLDRYGNTSAATIPIALDEVCRNGLVGPGSLIGIATFGAGFTWGAGLVRL
ncbi:MAG: ketoacyl-ACP synthase III [Desulfuromonadales bacterium]|nr:ketoacyl-ACP synthase III [Desulfuromonadales bacterium]